MQVDFTNQKLIYPKDLYTESDSVTGFTTTDGKARNENFVVFECVHRLLEQGYKPQDLVLEKTWKLGHTGKSGRADITIYKEAKDNKEKFIYAIIECKTAGKEYNKAKQDLFTNEEGNQLFSYAAQARSVEWLMLYASDFDERTKSISYKDEIIKFKDDDNVLDLALSDKSIQTFKQASEASDIFSAWEDTYNKQSYHDLIFKSQAYNIGILPLYKKDLKPFDESDSLNLKFREILRHNKVSNRNTAFDVLLAVFLAKCYDEKKNDDERLEFYYNPFSDDYFSLYKRLKRLFISAMIEFLNEEVFFIADDLVEKTFKDYFHTNRKQAQKILEDAISNAQNYSAQFFAFKKVYNKKLFNQNGKILVEVIQLFENYRLLYANKNQFISDLFEHFLNEGFTQNEGIYFTPTPITRFIWNSLPFEDFINLRNKTFPKVLDFACGAGHFLTEGVSAMSDYCKDTYLSIEDREISRYFYGIDADDRLAMTSQASMLLNGAGDNKIRFIDGLEYDKEFYGENQQDFDILVANPPYSVKEFKQHLSRSVLKGKNGNIPYKVLEYLSPNAKEIELVFIERLIHILKPNALCAIVLPSSILSNTDKATILAREIILQNFSIHAICSFGSQTFGTTGTNTAVLFLRRFDEPPKITELLEDSLEAIFDNQNLDGFIDKEILESYVSLQNIDLQDYKAFLKQEQIPSHELFKEYETAFNEQSEIKKYKDSKGFKDLDKKAQDQELEKRLFTFILECEREKLKYFALTYRQNTLIIKAPDDTAEQKRFLGFVINKSKTSNAGLQETQGLLSDKHNRNATDKIAFCIKQSFKGEFHTHEAFSKYIGFIQTCKLLQFENAVFNKAIIPIITDKQGEGKTQNPFENCKFELVRLEDICQFRRGSFPQPYGKQEWYDGANAMPFVQVADIGDNFKLKEKTNQQISQLAQPKSVFVPQNTIIVSIQGTIGRVAITQYDCYVDRTIAIFTELSNLLNQQFLAYMLSILFTSKAETARGITLKTITKEEFRNFKIPLPPLEIQKQIVSECEKVEEQYSTIRAVIEKYQELIRAILVKCGIVDSSESSKTFITSLLDSIQELESKLDFSLLSSLQSEVPAQSSQESSPSSQESETLSPSLRGSGATEAIHKKVDSSVDCHDFATQNLAMTGLDLKALLASLPTPPPHGWERVKVNQVAFYPQDRIEINLLTPHNYVGVDNLLQDKKGKRDAEFILEGIGTTNAYKKNDILIGNIRPYLKKIWLADIDGGTNGDVVVLRVRDSKVLSYKMLFYVMSDNNFFKYEMDNAKGLKMPRGDKTAILNYKIPLPPLKAQEKIISAIENIESKIHLLDSSLSHLDSKKSEILQHFLQN